MSTTIMVHCYLCILEDAALDGTWQRWMQDSAMNIETVTAELARSLFTIFQQLPNIISFAEGDVLGR